jgi:hypothetical protein
MEYNKFALFLTILYLIAFSNTIRTDFPLVKEVDYNVYYLSEPNMIVCSNMKQKSVMNNFILNEYETENGYACLLKLKTDGVYKIKLNFSVIKNNLDHLLKENDNQKVEGENNSIDISIGDYFFKKNLDLEKAEEGSVFKKDIIIRYEDNKVFLVNKSKLSSRDHEDEVKDVLFNTNFLKINFTFKKSEINNSENISLLEKKGKFYLNNIFYFS